MNEFESGLENRRRVLGEAWVAKSLGEANAMNAEFQTFITRHAWHDVWDRNHLTALPDKTRRLLVLAMTLGLGRYEEFSLHAKAGLIATDASALTIDDLREVVMQSAVYCGVPAANTAMHALAAVLKDVSQTPPKLHIHRANDFDATRATLVFSHALGYDHTMWNSVMPAFTPNYNVIAYDHRGQGKSQPSPTDFSIDALVDDAASVLLNEVFARGGGPVHFVGLSMGGMVAQGLAARFPHLVKSIVVANSAMHYDESAKAMWYARIATVNSKGMREIVEMLLERWFGKAFCDANPKIAAEVRQILLANNAVQYGRNCAAISAIDFARTNATISCPTTVIAGDRDISTLPALSEAIAASINGARLVRIDAGHVSAVERADDFVSLLHAHLAAL